MMQGALQECQEACLAKQEAALTAQREESLKEVQAALKQERDRSEALVTEMKVSCKICWVYMTCSVGWGKGSFVSKKSTLAPFTGTFIVASFSFCRHWLMMRELLRGRMQRRL